MRVTVRRPFYFHGLLISRKIGSSSFESLGVDILYELLDYFNLDGILHSFVNVCFDLEWIIFKDSRFRFRGVQLSKSRQLHPKINENRITSLALSHTAVSLSLFVNVRSLYIRTGCSYPDRLRQMSQEVCITIENLV
jgi:hypothetical protein